MKKADISDEKRNINRNVKVLLCIRTKIDIKNKTKHKLPVMRQAPVTRNKCGPKLGRLIKN